MKSNILLGIGLSCVLSGFATAQNLCLPQVFPEGLQPAGLTANARYGASVALYATRAVVGAPGQNANKGAIYVHTLSNGAFGPGTKLEGGGTVNGDEFGASVGTDGDLIVVGAPGDDAKGPDAGAVYVFRQQTINGVLTWTQAAKLFSKNAIGGARFGSSVAVQNKVVVVGAPFNTVLVSHQGTVHAFDPDAQYLVWTESLLVAADPQVDEHLGGAVAVDGKFVVAGAKDYDVANPTVLDVGRIYGFYREGIGGPWISKPASPFNGTTGRHFGASIAIKNGKVAVGAPGWINPSGYASGGCWLLGINASNQTMGIGYIQTFATLAGLAGQETGAGTSVGINSLRVYIGSPTQVEEEVYDSSTFAYHTTAVMHAPFYDLKTGTPEAIGTSFAANDFFCLAGRPDQGGGDLGHAFPFYLCGGEAHVSGNGTTGSQGEPRLRIEGPFVSGFQNELRLEYGKPNSIAFLAVHAGAPSPIAFHGGLLQAFPIHLLVNIPLNATGAFVLPSTFPAGLSNQKFTLQCLVSDPQGQGGLSLSNAEQMTTAM